MESKKINQLATELTPALSDLTIIGDPTTGISKKITLSQMASLFTGTVEEYANVAAFPLVGVADTIYIALDTNVLYRWNTGTSAYVELSPNIINSLVFSDANGFDGNISLVGSVATLTITTALTTGSVPFIGASGALSQDNANLFFDDTNNRLGINTNAPTTAIDVFGSGIIGRLNGTSTNNAFLGFASAGSNKWSIGNVQSDHRFRIYNEATTSELVSVLSTGEFGIGIANPTTKLHIDGGASALIANLDANVSVAKSISFRSDNSNRINLEVSGTESGSNAGANFFIRRYSDAGALIDTPLTITRSTGVVSLASALPISSGGTGSATQNFVDLTTTQSIGGAKTFTSTLSVSNSRINLFGNSSDGKAIMIFGDATYPTAALIAPNLGGTLLIAGQSGTGMTIGTTGSAAFISSATFAGYVGINGATSANPLTVKVDTNLQFRVDQYLGTTNLASINGTASAYAGMKIDGTTIEINSQSGGGINVGGASGFGKLDVGGQTSGSNQNIARFGNISGINNGLIIQVNSSNNYIYNFGTLGTGTVTATSGVLSATSDMNLKVEDGYINNALEKVMNLKPRYFYWKEETGLPIDLRQLGFYAQEVNEALGEEAANTPKTENDKWGIYDRGIVAFLTKAIQEQQSQIEELKAKIK